MPITMIAAKNMMLSAFDKGGIFEPSNIVFGLCNNAPRYKSGKSPTLSELKLSPLDKSPTKKIETWNGPILKNDVYFMESDVIRYTGASLSDAVMVNGIYIAKSEPSNEVLAIHNFDNIYLDGKESVLSIVCRIGISPTTTMFDVVVIGQ